MSEKLLWMIKQKTPATDTSIDWEKWDAFL